MSIQEKTTTNGKRFNRLSENKKSAIVFTAAITLICLAALWLS